ncbi:MAG: sigma-70 family RNA polymerase sigma factor [Armatimonadota bacterium]|nr:sigma-70 family RNA polymerase sigma factor [Armatimonadota bacterium]
MDQAVLLEAYLPLVGAIARALGRGLPTTVEFDDLVADGVIGLAAALRRYDPARRVGFSTYAGHRIRGAMLDGLRARSPVSRSARRAQRAASGAAAAQIASGVVLVGLDQALEVSDDEAASPEAQAIETDLRRRAWAALAALPPRDRQVLELRLVQGLTLREAAARLGLSITRTAEIHARGVARLRRLMRGEPALASRRTPRAVRQEVRPVVPKPWAASHFRTAAAPDLRPGAAPEAVSPQAGP